MTTTLPAASARHCVSTWRGLSRYFSTKHSPRPNAVIASRVAESNSSGTSSTRAGDLEAAPAAAVRGLDRDRAGRAPRRTRAPRRRRETGPGRAGRERCADLLGDVAGGDLVAERLDRLGARADPDEPGADDGAGEVGVLGEEAVAGVHRVGAGAAGDREDLLDRRGRCRRSSSRRGRTPRRRDGRAGRRGPGRRRRRPRPCPQSRAARMTRTAISPRFAMSTLAI